MLLIIAGMLRLQSERGWLRIAFTGIGFAYVEGDKDDCVFPVQSLLEQTAPQVAGLLLEDAVDLALLVSA